MWIYKKVEQDKESFLISWHLSYDRKPDPKIFYIEFCTHASFSNIFHQRFKKSQSLL